MKPNDKELLSGKFGPGDIVKALGKNVTLEKMFWAFRRLILAEDIRPQLLSQSEMAFYSGAMTVIEIYCWTHNAKLSERERTDLIIKIREEILEYGERAHIRT
jgi:hypothetical protein